MNEKKRRCNDILTKNQNLPTSQQRTMKIVKGHLQIENQNWVQPIQPSPPSNLLDITPEQMDDVIKIILEASDTVTLNKSKFMVFACRAYSHDDLYKAYTKIKILQGSARHIVCAYSVSTPDQTWGEGYCDDEEHGAGCHLLRLLKERNNSNICVFVARHYGGVHLGSKRFQIYKQTATNALNKVLPDNLAKVTQNLSVSANSNDTSYPDYPDNTANSQSFGSFVAPKEKSTASIRGRGAHSQSSRQRLTASKPQPVSSYADILAMPVIHQTSVAMTLPKQITRNGSQTMTPEVTTFNFSKPMGLFHTNSDWDEDEWHASSNKPAAHSSYEHLVDKSFNWDHNNVSVA